MIQVGQIKKQFSATLKWESGEDSITAKSVKPATHCLKNSLCFVSSEADARLAIENGASILIALSGCSIPVITHDIALFRCDNIKQSMALVLPLFVPSKIGFHSDSNIHPTAVIHPDASIHKTAIIGPHCTIGARAVIGAHTELIASVFVGHDCQIGNHCRIHPHSTIGSDGYGYYTTAQFEHHKIPQLGNVIIEDHVEIGSQVAIDRATLTSTIIRSGAKLDNLIHIAHNVEVGENSLITAGFFTAGSTSIGKRFVCGGNTAVADHISIADDVMVAGRSTILSDISKPGQYGGHPLVPMKDYLKNLAVLKKIFTLKK